MYAPTAGGKQQTVATSAAVKQDPDASQRGRAAVLEYLPRDCFGFRFKGNKEAAMDGARLMI